MCEHLCLIIDKKETQRVTLLSLSLFEPHKCNRSKHSFMILPHMDNRGGTIRLFVNRKTKTHVRHNIDYMLADALLTHGIPELILAINCHLDVVHPTLRGSDALAFFGRRRRKRYEYSPSWLSHKTIPVYPITTNVYFSCFSETKYRQGKVIYKVVNNKVFVHHRSNALMSFTLSILSNEKKEKTERRRWRYFWNITAVATLTFHQWCE